MINMDNVMDDTRFKHIARDPRFRRMKRTDRKVKIDKRFQGMFNDKEFKLKYSVDKRGRPIQSTTSENLQKYYDLASSDDSGDDNEEGEKPEEDKTEKEKISDEKAEDSSENEEEEEPGTSKKPAESGDSDEEGSGEEDFARGQGNVETSSSEDEEDEEDDALDHKWGELANDATTVNDATSRLALCNMDWDRIKASDILVLMNSFKPPNGTVKSVRVYPSEYGLERMEEENQKGPQLMESKHEEEDDSVAQRERLRQYQLTRLKYYYAVVVCDSAETANSVYSGCDGLEYESSSTKIDLRFIPEDMTFDQKPKSEATSMPDVALYKPALFKTTALNQSKVQLTWDETDKDRIAMTMKKFKDEELEEMNVKDYLASSSGSDGEGGDPYAGFEDPDFGPVEDKNEKADKLKELVKEEKESKEEPAELQITWESGTSSNATTALKKKKEGGLTPWEEYLERKKEKKKQRREEKKKPKDGDEPPDEDNAFSDDELPEGIDMNDPYFQEELSAQNGDSTKTDQKGKSKKKKKKNVKKTEAEKEDEARLDMLMMDEEDGREHFNLAAIQNKEAGKKKNKKQRKKQENTDKKDTQDTFKLNVEDSRFTDIYQNPLFNIDPSAPEYKKTQAMDSLVQEKFKRRKKQKNKDSTNVSKKPKLDTQGLQDPSLAFLVKSVKAKTKTLQEKKKKKLK